jgi:pyruvate kinase
MQRAVAIVVSDAGLSSHTAIVGLNLGKPVVLGVRIAPHLPHGELVTVDAGRGMIYRGRVRPV